MIRTAILLAPAGTDPFTQNQTKDIQSMGHTTYFLTYHPRVEDDIRCIFDLNGTADLTPDKPVPENILTNFGIGTGWMVGKIISNSELTQWLDGQRYLNHKMSTLCLRELIGLSLDLERRLRAAAKTAKRKSKSKSRKSKQKRDPKMKSRK